MAGLPKCVKQHLHASCQMDKMDITQVLTHAGSILKDNPMVMELATAALRPMHDPVEGIVSELTKFCVHYGLNHMACDCLTRCKKLKDKCLKKPHVLPVQGAMSFVVELFGKRIRTSLQC